MTDQEIIARALDALPDHLDYKRETADYEDDDLARMSEEAEKASALTAELNGGCRVLVLDPAQVRWLRNICQRIDGKYDDPEPAVFLRKLEDPPEEGDDHAGN